MGSRAANGFEIDVPRRLVEITLSGELTDETLVEIHERVRNDSAIRADFAAWADLRAVDARRVTSRGLRHVAGLWLPFEPATRCAIVVASDLAYGLARMYQALRGGLEDTILVSRDAQAARHWLVEPDAPGGAA